MTFHLFELRAEVLASANDCYGVVERAPDGRIVNKARRDGVVDLAFPVFGELRMRSQKVQFP